MNDEYGLQVSFGIDNGELDGETPQQVFCLGFEVGKTYEICERLSQSAGKPIGTMYPVHSVNEQRLRKVVEAFPNLSVVFAWLNDDWQQIQIERKGI